MVTFVVVVEPGYKPILRAGYGHIASRETQIDRITGQPTGADTLIIDGVTDAGRLERYLSSKREVLEYWER